MKLIDAVPRLGSRFPHLMAQADDEHKMLMCQQAIADARDDIEVLQVLAHSLRTAKQWRLRHSAAGLQMTRAELVAIPLEKMTDAQLRKRASYGGNSLVRAAINKEVIRRAQAASAHDIPAQGEQPQPADALKSALTAAFGKEPNPPLAVDDEADDRL